MLVRISSAGTVGTSNSGSATGGTANTRGCKRTEIPARAPLLTCSDRVAWLWCLLPPEHLLDPLDNKLHLPVQADGFSLLGTFLWYLVREFCLWFDGAASATATAS